jgi:Tol biopolymer transport system component
MDMSDDGSVVAWTTTTALDSQDTNGVSDVYLVDASQSSPRRVSLSSTGGQQNDPGGPGDHTDTGQVATSRWVGVSGDGTRVAFDSRSTNLVPEDENTANDVFLHDLRTGSTSRVSVSSTGAEGNGNSYRPSLSRDGGVIAFETEASNFDGSDDNRLSDVFVHDLRGV